MLNEHIAPTYAFQVRPDLDLSNQRMKRDLQDALVDGRTNFVDANRLVDRYMGDTALANIFLLGFALQRGLLPVGIASVERAIELNGVAIDANKRALSLGRLAAHDVKSLDRPVGDTGSDAELVDFPETLDEIVELQTSHLTAYQNEAYAARYRAWVERAAQGERSIASTRDDYSRAVARYYAKLLAYKDEYEVARLYGDRRYWQSLDREFEKGYALRLHLAPPLLSKRNPITGEIEKREFGSWIWPLLRVLSGLRFLRGSRFDLFGRTIERRMERELIAAYETTIEELTSGLTPENYELAVEIASLPEQIRGFGPVKTQHVDAAKIREQELLTGFRNSNTSRLRAAS